MRSFRTLVLALIVSSLTLPGQAQTTIVSQSALPTGAATSANQTTLNGYVDGVETLLASIETLLGGTIDVACISGCGGSGGASQADNSAVTDITGVGALYDTTPPTITDGNVGLPRMDSSRYLYTVFPSAQAVTATDLDVQSGGVDLATSTQAGAIQTAVELIDNAISGAGFNITQFGGAAIPMTTTQADNLALTLDALNVTAFMYMHDGTNYDMVRGDTTNGLLVNLGTNNDVDTELAAAILAADNMSLPTAPWVLAAMMCYDATGTNMDLCRSSSAVYDEAAKTDGPQGFLRFDEVSVDTVDENDAVSWRGSNTGEAYTIIRDAAGNARGANVNASGQLAIAGPVTNAGTFAVQVDGAALTALQLLDNAVADHSATDVAGTFGIGFRAVAHGANPTAVDAGERTVGYASRAGVPFVIGGHPNVITLEAQVEDGDGAQTNAAIVTVGSGSKIVVTRSAMKCDDGNSGPVNAVIGFGASTLPARAHTGVAGIIDTYDGIPAGGGSVTGGGSGILGVGADGEDLRITMEDPAGGACSIIVSYYTVDS